VIIFPYNLSEYRWVHIQSKASDTTQYEYFLVVVCNGDNQSIAERDQFLLGSKATEEYVEWHASIYDVTNEKIICGGSLLSKTVVLTGKNIIEK
jgi:hypothetical protein